MNALRQYCKAVQQRPPHINDRRERLLRRCFATQTPSIYLYKTSVAAYPTATTASNIERLTSTVEQVGELIYGANHEMVSLETIRTSNAAAKQHLSSLVAVFVGGTGGIGESTAKELFQRTPNPKAYIIGRNASRGESLVSQLHEINPQGQAIFWKADISLLRNVDTLCDALRKAEPKIHCLFLTAGYMTLQGRYETIEGLDRKMVVNYYARFRCVENLMPLLTAASDAGELSRVITVLAAGSEGEVRIDDLDLRHNFTLHACLAHCVVMSDFAVEEYARRFPGTSFSHSYPGTVKTGIANELTGPVRLAVKVLYAVMSPWIIKVQESGERHFFQMTSQCYPSRRGGVGVPIPEGMQAIKGVDGRRGSGGYLLDWDGKATGDESVLNRYRERDMPRLVYEHTQQMFAQAMERNKKEGKRPASGDLEGCEDRLFPGWRPAA